MRSLGRLSQKLSSKSKSSLDQNPLRNSYPQRSGMWNQRSPGHYLKTARRGRRPYLWYAAAADDSELCERRVPAAGLTQRVGRPHPSGSIIRLVAAGYLIYCSNTGSFYFFCLSFGPCFPLSQLSCGARHYLSSDLSSRGSKRSYSTAPPSSGQPKAKATRNKLTRAQKASISITDDIQELSTGMMLGDTSN